MYMYMYMYMYVIEKVNQNPVLPAHFITYKLN